MELSEVARWRSACRGVIWHAPLLREEAIIRVNEAHTWCRYVPPRGWVPRRVLAFKFVLSGCVRSGSVQPYAFCDPLRYHRARLLL